MKKIIGMIVGIWVASAGALLGETRMVQMPRPINVQMQNQVQPEELLDLEAEDLFTHKTFGGLMEEKHADELPYIVARVVTRGPGGDSVNYGNAHDLNKLFGGYPLKTSTPSYNYKAPYNGFPIQQADYFIIKNSSDPAFSYLCSYYDLMIDPIKKEACKQHFYANQTDNTKLHVKAQIGLAANKEADPVITTQAKMRLGEIFYEGLYGVAKDYDQASNYLEDVVENGQINAAALERAHGMLGQIYYSGDYGAHKNYAKACRSFEHLLHEERDAAALATIHLKLGQMYYAGGHNLATDYLRARDYFQQVAVQNADPAASIRAQYRLGQLYYRGHGVGKNYQLASRYLKSVAHQRAEQELAADACLLLGEMSYLGGYGISQNYMLASSYYEKAADQALNPAIAARADYWLGEMHYFGQTPDYADAQRLWEKVARQRDNRQVAARAQYRLGTLYQEGKGVNKNNRLALRYFKEAAEQTRDPWAAAEARSWLASLHYQGDGLRRDYKRAAEHWEYVAQQQHSPDACIDAQLGLGEIYCVGGYGVGKDHDRARACFEQVIAAEPCDSESALHAQEWLAWLEKINEVSEK